MDWLTVAEDRVKWWIVVNAVMSVLVTKKIRNGLTR
jgi:hypothetical protein